MGVLTQQLPGLSTGLFRMMFGVLWLDAALQKAPWVINPQGQPFGWLSNWIWTEIQHPTFDVYKAFLETVVFPNLTLFGYMVSSLRWLLASRCCLACAPSSVASAAPCGSSTLPSGATQCRLSGTGSGPCSLRPIWCLPIHGLGAFSALTCFCKHGSTPSP